MSDSQPITCSSGRGIRRRLTEDLAGAEIQPLPKRRRVAHQPRIDPRNSSGHDEYPSATLASLSTPEPSALGEHCHTFASSKVGDDGLSDKKHVFPFMELPAELRVNIYRMALQRDEPLLLHLQRTVEQEDAKGGVSDRSSRPRTSAMSRNLNSRDHLISDVSDASQKDHINPALLRTCRQVYKEARQVLYSDNEFVLSLASGIHTLSNLHQRSRSLIKSVSLAIPSHHDILDGFADLVRLGLRYCWGLKKFTIVLSTAFPDDRVISGASSVYANAFHILRWLPKGCKVVLDGTVSDVVRNVVAEEGRLQEQLDETSYLKRQHQMPERH